MKIAFDVDVLAKQMDINRMVHQVADWGYKYIEQSPHPRINPFYKHPLFSKECEQEYRKALRETGVEISSFIVVYRWSGPTEEQRKMAVANWKRMIEIAVNMGVPVKVISEHLGHCDTRTTENIYAHIFAETRAKASDAISQALGTVN